MNRRSDPRLARDGREPSGKGNAAHTPLSKCVNAVAKGLRREIDGEAANKGVRRGSTVDSLRFKAWTELWGGMGQLTGWRLHVMPFFRPLRGSVRHGRTQ